MIEFVFNSLLVFVVSTASLRLCRAFSSSDFGDGDGGLAPDEEEGPECLVEF